MDIYLEVRLFRGTVTRIEKYNSQIDSRTVWVTDYWTCSTLSGCITKVRLQSQNLITGNFEFGCFTTRLELVDLVLFRYHSSSVQNSIMCIRFLFSKNLKLSYEVWKKDSSSEWVKYVWTLDQVLSHLRYLIFLLTVVIIDYKWPLYIVQSWTHFLFSFLLRFFILKFLKFFVFISC